MVRRRVTKLGTLVLGMGAGLNLSWEATLWVVGGRAYESPLSPPLHMVLQALTEFGPLFLGFVLAADWLGWARLDGWRAPTPARSWERALASYAMVGAGLVVLVSAVTFFADRGDVGQVRVFRHVDPVFFLSEMAIALATVAGAWMARSRRALAWFFCMGGLNVGVEVGGILLGFRSYGDAPSALSLAIGFGEGGAAAALTWLAVERVRALGW